MREPYYQADERANYWTAASRRLSAASLTTFGRRRK